MSDLETYNRVPTLESQFIKRLLVTGYVAMVFVAALGLASYLLLADPWPHTLLISGAILVACLLVINFDNHRPRRCQFCRSTLDPVIRPLLLTDKYLSMEGRKIGNAFYTRQKQGLLQRKRWVKLSNQSLACHHCRLTEEAYREVQQTPSAEEVDMLESDLASAAE